MAGRGVRAAGGARLQYAALPYRVTDDLEVLLITSRQTGRWVLPKGWPIKGKKPHDCAAQEAMEEAGVRGKIGKASLGFYRYLKRLPDGVDIACVVAVYPLLVQRQLDRWPEQGQRTIAWFSAPDAASRVEEGELQSLIRAFAGGRGETIRGRTGMERGNPSDRSKPPAPSA